MATARFSTCGDGSLATTVVGPLEPLAYVSVQRANSTRMPTPSPIVTLSTAATSAPSTSVSQPASTASIEPGIMRSLYGRTYSPHISPIAVGEIDLCRGHASLSDRRPARLGRGHAH